MQLYLFSIQKGNYMKKITKAVIPIGGFGTRFLPITKAVPKEMLPIVDKPVIQYILEELASSGIEEVYMVISEDKDAIINYFSRNKRLEDRLIITNKNNNYKEIVDLTSIVKIHFILEKEQTGSAKAIYLAKKYLKNEDAFAIVLADDLIKNYDSPALNQLIKVYNETHGNVIGVHKVLGEEVHKYGIIYPDENSNYLKGIIEKPSKEKAPSNYAALGRYIVTNDIFDYIKDLKKGYDGEYQLTDALNLMIQDNKIFRYKVIEGDYFDIGSKEGHINAVVSYAKDSDNIDNNKLDFI